MFPRNQVAAAIELTCLKPFAVATDIHQVCKDALEWHFHGVCIPPIWLKEARTYLGSDRTVKLITVIGFPTGAVSTAVKSYEIEEALKLGADEIDFVLNIGWLKEHRFEALAEEFKQLVNKAASIPLKVILETCYLTDFEKQHACQTALAAGVQFVKTSTGFGAYGATPDDVRSLRRWAPLVKASGGIKDAHTALELLEAGACRLGTSSGTAIMQSIQQSDSGC